MGLVTSSTDADNNVTTVSSYDAFGRPTLIREAAGSQIERQTSIEYSDTARRVITRSDLNATGDARLVTVKHYDQLGRIRLSRQLEDVTTQSAVDETKGIKTQTRYAYGGPNSYELVSSPYRADYSSSAGGEGTMGWIRTKRDSGGRVIEVQTYGGSALPPPWGSNSSSTGAVTTQYNAEQTTVTDQAGKTRKSIIDAIGRLTQVVEDPLGLAYPTNYTYDAQDDLTAVQQGVQARTFSYNSLKQLMSATNPESGTVSYAYHANGNLTSKTDARGITTSYAYDALNRVTSRSYSDLVTPAVNYSYDSLSVANSKGRLTQVSSSVSTTNYGAYDALGRITGSSQTTNGQTYTLGYGYNLAGGLTSQTYPSGRILTASYDAAGRVSGVSGQKTGEANKTYASLLSYAPQGAVSSMTLGNSLAEAAAFNNRLQPTSISLGTLATFGYSYGTTNNNGNVLSQAITAPAFTVTQNYSYAPLNRLTGVSETSGWNQTYGYDRYGNRNAGSSSSAFMPLQVPAISESSNKITAANYGYDSAGNLTQGLNKDGVSQTFAYDAENKLANFNGGAATYAYDGDGRRVKKVVGSTTMVFIYNARGQLVAEYTTPAPTTAGGTSYLTTDHLGSTRVVTNQSGSVIARHDYLPFVEEIPSLFANRSSVAGYDNTDNTRQKFTGKERDAESGLDNFGARYISAAQGRFCSADLINVTRKRLINPANTLNKYAYAANNPLLYVDPTGEDITVFYRAASGAAGDHGHVFLAVTNQATGQVRFADYYPQGAKGLRPAPGEFNKDMTADRIKEHAALTIIDE